eukprot:g4256.t1
MFERERRDSGGGGGGGGSGRGNGSNKPGQQRHDGHDGHDGQEQEQRRLASNGAAAAEGGMGIFSDAAMEARLDQAQDEQRYGALWKSASPGGSPTSSGDGRNSKGRDGAERSGGGRVAAAAEVAAAAAAAVSRAELTDAICRSLEARQSKAEGRASGGTDGDHGSGGGGDSTDDDADSGAVDGGFSRPAAPRQRRRPRKLKAQGTTLDRLQRLQQLSPSTSAGKNSSSAGMMSSAAPTMDANKMGQQEEQQAAAKAEADRQEAAKKAAAKKAAAEKAAVTAEVAAAEHRAAFRERLSRYYAVHNPEKLGQLDFLVEKYQRPDLALRLFTQMVAKYGPEPSDEEVAAARGSSSSPSSSASSSSSSASSRPALVRVKCADCGEAVDIEQLAQHTCPAVRSSPVAAAAGRPSSSTKDRFAEKPDGEVRML